MRPFYLALLCLPLFVLSARAGETAWQEVAPDVSIRLISSGSVDASGRALFALEIDMPSNTKTYWRIPGETGLPTELDFSASSGVAGHAQHWPLPERISADGYLDHVYFGHTVLPVELVVDNPAGAVNLQATLGICSDICVPAQAQFALPLTDSALDKANSLRIRQALADVPIAWDNGPEPIGAVALTSDSSAIAVEIDSSVLDPDSLIVAGDLEAPLFGAPQKSPQDNLVLLPIMDKTDNSVLDGLEVELSFMTATGAYEVSRTIEAGADASVDVRGH